MRCAAALLAALIAVGFGLAGPVQAGPASDFVSERDGAFLAALDAAGITYRDGDQAVITAKMVCRFIVEGKPSTAVVEGLTERNPGLSVEHGTQFVGIAAHTYCPEQLVAAGAPPPP